MTHNIVSGAAAGAICVCALATRAGAGAEQPMFSGLGHLPGGSASSAAAISADGAAVAGWAATPAGDLAFRWTSGTGLQPLGDLPGGAAMSRANGINGDGSIIVGVSASAQCPGGEAFLWTAGKGMTSLGELPGGAPASSALAVSANGLVIVGVSSGPFGETPVRWTPELGLHPIAPPFGLEGAACALSPDGVVAAGDIATPADNDSPGMVQVYRWTEQIDWLSIEFLDNSCLAAHAAAVAEAGECIVGWAAIADGSDCVSRPFRWTPLGGTKNLGALPGGGSAGAAASVSSDGSVVAGWSTTAAGQEAFIWDEASGMRRLAAVLSSKGADLTGWTLLEATAVSADGLTVAGNGINPDGQPEAWIARLTPSCPADCDGSGGADMFDLICFTDAFNAGAAAADRDQNGVIDLIDFLTFAEALSDGC